MLYFIPSLIITNMTLLIHGFRPELSCQTQLVLLVDDILKTIDSHHQAVLLLFDFSKAFDTVAHNILLLNYKLTHYGIQSNTYQWIPTWLTTRTQREELLLKERNLAIEECYQEYLMIRELFWNLLCFYYLKSIANRLRPNVHTGVI